MFLILAFTAAGSIGLYFFRRNLRLNGDRDQHHLASMLVSIAAGRDEVSREDVRAFLRAKDYGVGERLYRLNHAVKLAGTAVKGPVHAGVVALARELRDRP